MNRRAKLVTGILLALSAVVIVASAIRAADSEPDLRITFSHFAKKGEYTLAVMDIRNVGDAPARYYGYSKDSPSCDLVHKDSLGAWQDRIFKCGTGLTPQLLFPGEQLRTTNYIYGSENWKVGLSYSKPQFRDRLPSRLQSFLRFLPYSSVPYSKAWSPEMPALTMELAAAKASTHSD